MPRKSKKATKDKAEQLDLIDVQPENKKQILRDARAYKEAQAERIEALNEEKKYKKKLLETVRAAGLQADNDGVIKFRLDGVVISVQPRDELVKVKFDEGEDE